MLPFCLYLLGITRKQARKHTRKRTGKHTRKKEKLPKYM